VLVAVELFVFSYFWNMIFRNSKLLTILFIMVWIFQLEIQAQFKHEVLVGGGIHTSGFQVAGSYTLFNKKNDGLQFIFEFSEIKNPKEKVITAERLAIGGNSNRTYIYGKQNNFYQFTLSAGQRFYISERTERSIVAIAFGYQAGVELGIEKPYYLDLIYRIDPDGFRVVSERFSETNRLKFLEPLDINGATGFSAGWDQLTLHPGITCRGNLLFDWGPKDAISKILELGLKADIFFKNIPIMVDEQRLPIFVNLYANFYFGKRW